MLEIRTGPGDILLVAYATRIESITPMELPPRLTLEHWMDLALVEARRASDLGEVPVGAVVVNLPDARVVGSGHNQTESAHDASAHAEILALRRAGESLGDWRLESCALVSTLEPCTMCMGALKLARIPLLVFGPPDLRLGACGTLFDLAPDSRIGPVPRVVRDIRSRESEELLKAFFRFRRG